MAFNIAGARKEGHADAEIADYLVKNRGSVKFDVQGALKEGYTPTEVLDHLSPAPSAIKDVLKQGASGVAEGLAGIPGATARMLEAAGEYVQPYLEHAGLVHGKDNLDPLQPSAEARRQELKALIASQPNSIQSMERKLQDALPAPETDAGTLARAGGRFIPATVLGMKGNPLKAAGIGAAGGVGSELAGQAAEGTGFETPARIAGGVVSMVAAPSAMNAVSASAQKLAQASLATKNAIAQAAPNAWQAVKDYAPALAADMAAGAVTGSPIGMGAMIGKVTAKGIRGAMKGADAEAPAAAEAAVPPGPRPWGEPQVGPTGPSVSQAPEAPVLAKPPAGFEKDLTAQVRALNKADKLKDKQTALEAMPLIKELARRSQLPKWQTPGMPQDITPPPAPAPQLTLPKPAWQAPGVNEVPPRPPIAMPAPASIPALPAPRPGPSSPLPSAMPGAPIPMGGATQLALPKPPWQGGPQGPAIPMPAPAPQMALPAPAGAQAMPAPVITAKAITKANGKITTVPNERPAPADDFPDIPDFLKRGPAAPAASVAPPVVNPAALPSVQAQTALSRISAPQKIADKRVAKAEAPAAPETAPANGNGSLLEALERAQNGGETVSSADNLRSLDLKAHSSAGMGSVEAAYHIADMMKALGKPVRDRGDFASYVQPFIQAKDDLSQQIARLTGVSVDKLAPHTRAIATRAEALEWRKQLQQFEPEKASRIADAMNDKLIRKLWRK